MADLYLPLKPRSDLALINAMLRILIDEELYDKDYVEQHTTGFAELRASLEPYTLEYAANITGLAPELIHKTALLYGKAKAAFIGWTMGVNHSTKGTETVNAINNLALITGNIGRSGASPFSITGQCNAMGTREAGFSSALPGYRKFESEQDREELARLWNLPVDRIPAKRGLAYPGHHRSRCRRKDSRALDHRHQSAGLVSQYRRAQAGAWAIWIFWSCRMAFIRRRQPNWPIWFCRPPSGAKRKEPTPTPSAA